jgi:hypothetical protein
MSAGTCEVTSGEEDGAGAVHPAKKIAVMTRMIVTKQDGENFMIHPLIERVIFPGQIRRAGI